ncbi:MAG: hypothetical protein WCT46_00710 [Candidatus Gracilibacteria bacterium]|jgi:hypothetical protein
MPGPDGQEKYEERACAEWEQYVDDVITPLADVPAECMHQGPTFMAPMRDGGQLICETCYYNFNYGNTFLDVEPVVSGGVGVRHVLMAKNQNGEMVGIRRSTISYVEGAYDRFEVGSKVIVKYRGRGLASAVENAFSQVLQWWADTFKKDVVERASNENLSNLYEARIAVNEGYGDPSFVTHLEEEQRRWQTLYGDSGKMGFEKGKRVFKPKEVGEVT